MSKGVASAQRCQQPVGRVSPRPPDSPYSPAGLSLNLPIQRLLQPGLETNPVGWGQPTLPVDRSLILPQRTQSFTKESDTNGSQGTTRQTQTEWNQFTIHRSHTKEDPIWNVVSAASFHRAHGRRRVGSNKRRISDPLHSRRMLFSHVYDMLNLAKSRLWRSRALKKSNSIARRRSHIAFREICV